MGSCGACGGMGGRFWYGMGMMPCSLCGGSGRCPHCRGDGVSVMNTMTTQSGLTIGYDERGNRYIAGPGSKNERTRYHGSSYYNCCDGIATFGKELYHKCSNCGSTHRMGSHICKK